MVLVRCGTDCRQKYATPNIPREGQGPRDAKFLQAPHSAPVLQHSQSSQSYTARQKLAAEIVTKQQLLSHKCHQAQNLVPPVCQLNLTSFKEQLLATTVLLLYSLSGPRRHTDTSCRHNVMAGTEFVKIGKIVPLAVIAGDRRLLYQLLSPHCALCCFKNKSKSLSVFLLS